MNRVGIQDVKDFYLEFDEICMRYKVMKLKIVSDVQDYYKYKKQHVDVETVSEVLLMDIRKKDIL